MCLFHMITELKTHQKYIDVCMLKKYNVTRMDEKAQATIPDLKEDRF